MLSIPCWKSYQGEGGIKTSVTLAAEEPGAPKHGEERRVGVPTVLARKEFVSEKNQNTGKTERKSFWFTHE